MAMIADERAHVWHTTAANNHARLLRLFAISFRCEKVRHADIHTSFIATLVLIIKNILLSKTMSCSPSLHRDTGYPKIRDV